MNTTTSTPNQNPTRPNTHSISGENMTLNEFLNKSFNGTLNRDKSPESFKTMLSSKEDRRENGKVYFKNGFVANERAIPLTPNELKKFQKFSDIITKGYTDKIPDNEMKYLETFLGGLIPDNTAKYHLLSVLSENPPQNDNEFSERSETIAQLLNINLDVLNGYEDGTSKAYYDYDNTLGLKSEGEGSQQGHATRGLFGKLFNRK